jgi:hypothetical protein
MSLRRLRARLDRLELSASTMPGQDRKRDRIRRDELSFRKRQQEVLTDREEDDLLALETLLYDEDQDHSRMMDLVLKQFNAEIRWREPLTDDEKRELAELERRFPPDPNDPFKPAMEAIRQVLEEEDRRTSR